VFAPYFQCVLKVQDVAVDPVTRRVWRDEREIVFSRKESTCCIS
jgi:DNA-binding response OmpR family regulator